MSDAMTVTYAENTQEKNVQDMRRAAAYALAHLAKKSNEDITGVLNIVHCLSTETLEFMIPQLSLLLEVAQNERSRRA